MAHFAQLDENNIVTQVIVVSNEDTSDINGVECEEIGIGFCKKLFGSSTRWLQTSYNSNMRRRYAGIGYSYNEEFDAFIPPKIYDSWILDQESLDWISPIGPAPKFTPEQISAGAYYRWDDSLYKEDNTSGWVLEIPEPSAEDPAQ